MRTLTCLVIDDEPIILQRLTKIFDKFQADPGCFLLVGTAASAREGIRLAQELKPDIVLTDIVMPGMNGIEMIAELKPQLPHSVFIILSAYTDFQYAKDAISMNVMDYLVKVPMNEAELLRVLEKARNTICSDEEKAANIQHMQQSIRQNKYRLRKQYMEELLTGDRVAAPAYERMLRELELAFTPQEFGCFVLCIDHLAQFQSNYNSRDQKVIQYAILNIGEEIIAGFGSGFMVEKERSLFVGYISLACVRSSKRMHDMLYELGGHLHMKLKQFLKISVSIGISSIRSGWEHMQTSYREACDALQDSFYGGPGSIIAPHHRLVYGDDGIRQLKELRGRCTGVIDGRCTLEEWREQLDRLVSHRAVHPKRLRETAEEILIRLRQTGQADGESELKSGLASVQYAGEFADMLLAELKLIVERKRQGAVKERKEITEAKRYIRQHLSSGISLQEVAEHVGLNSTYMSELFKKELGEGFSDYTNRMRIEKAIELLEKRAYSNVELCREVGLLNERYFCTLFKKYTGTTPQKYNPGTLDKPIMN